MAYICWITFLLLPIFNGFLFTTMRYRQEIFPQRLVKRRTRCNNLGSSTLCSKKPILMIFCMLNREYEHLTHMFTSPVRCSHCNSGNLTFQAAVQQLQFVSFWGNVKNLKLLLLCTFNASCVGHKVDESQTFLKNISQSKVAISDRWSGQVCKMFMSNFLGI